MDEKIICSVCEEPIEDNEEMCECDCCSQPFHWGDCGGFGSFYGLDTAGCDNCKKWD